MSLETDVQAVKEQTTMYEARLEEFLIDGEVGRLGNYAFDFANMYCKINKVKYGSLGWSVVQTLIRNEMVVSSYKMLMKIANGRDITGLTLEIPDRVHRSDVTKFCPKRKRLK
jgi:hypothetical protein